MITLTELNMGTFMSNVYLVKQILEQTLLNAHLMIVISLHC